MGGCRALRAGDKALGIQPKEVERSHIGVMLGAYELLGGIGVISSMMVVGSGGTIKGVLWLVGAYLSVAVGMILRGLGLMGYLVIVVYIGAIVILILIVLMLVEERERREDYMGGYIGVMGVMGGLIGAMVYLEDKGDQGVSIGMMGGYKVMGLVLYGEYVWVVMIGVMLLLVAMVGSMELLRANGTGRV